MCTFSLLIDACLILLLHVHGLIEISESLLLLLLSCFSYLELGGESINAIRYLSSGYKGLPLMINVLVDWLHFAGKIILGMHLSITNQLNTVYIQCTCTCRCPNSMLLVLLKN